MKITCGTDIIEIERIKQCIEKLKNTFVNKVYTETEINYCESKKRQKFQHYAARFAAKEASFKAISSKLEDKYSLSWRDIEIQNDKQGRPQLKVFGMDLGQIIDMDVSISHCKDYAVANVVIIWND